MSSIYLIVLQVWSVPALVPALQIGDAVAGVVHEIIIIPEVGHENVRITREGVRVIRGAEVIVGLLLVVCHGHLIIAARVMWM